MKKLLLQLCFFSALWVSIKAQPSQPNLSIDPTANDLRAIADGIHRRLFPNQVAANRNTTAVGYNTLNRTCYFYCGTNGRNMPARPSGVRRHVHIMEIIEQYARTVLLSRGLSQQQVDQGTNQFIENTTILIATGVNNDARFLDQEGFNFQNVVEIGIPGRPANGLHAEMAVVTLHRTRGDGSRRDLNTTIAGSRRYCRHCENYLVANQNATPRYIIAPNFTVTTLNWPRNWVHPPVNNNTDTTDRNRVVQGNRRCSNTHGNSANNEFGTYTNDLSDPNSSANSNNNSNTLVDIRQAQRQRRRKELINIDEEGSLSTTIDKKLNINTAMHSNHIDIECNYCTRNISIEMFSISGKLMKTYKTFEIENFGEGLYSIHKDELKNGLYLIKVGDQVKKIIL